MKKKDLLIFIILCIFWGISVNAIKVGLNDGFSIYLFASLRFLIGGFLILPFIYILNRNNREKSLIKLIKVEKIDLFKILLLSVFMFIIPYLLIYSGMKYLPSAIAGILNTTQVIITFILAHIILKENNLTFFKISGIIIGISGVVLLILTKNNGINVNSSANFLKGFLIYVCGCGSFSIASIIAKKLVIKTKIEISTMYQAIFGGLIILIISIFFEKKFNINISYKGWFSLFYLAIFGTAIPFILYYDMLNRLGPSILSTMQLVIPFLAAIIGYFILKEFLNIFTILSGLIILIGVAFILFGNRKQLKIY